MVAESIVHLIYFTASRQYVAPKTPPSTSRKPLCAVNHRQRETMRSILLILIVCISPKVYAQLQPGVYQSIGSSFRLNYYLRITDDSLTFFGWEISGKSDTIYFKSSCKFDTIGAKNFTRFEFSKNRPDPKRPDSFVAQADLLIDLFRLHRHLSHFRQNGRYIHVTGTKDIYDSRADEFLFQKIQ